MWRILSSKENVKNIQEFTQVIKLHNYLACYHTLQPTQSKESKTKKNICLNIIHSRKKYLIIKLKEHERELLKRIPTHKWSCKQM